MRRQLVEQIPLPPPVAPLFINFPPPPIHLNQLFQHFIQFLQLPPPPPPPQEPSVLEPVQMQQEAVEPPEQVELLEEEQVEVQGDEIIVVGEVAPPERRRRRTRRVRDEYVVESVVDRRYFHRVEQFLIKWSGYDDDENSWEDGHEKRREIPDAISLYF